MGILKKLPIAAAVVIFAGIVAITLAGSFVPAQRSFSNEIEINAPPEVVWEVITDKRRYTEWQTQLERTEIIDDKNWVEYPRSAPEPLRFHLASDERPNGMAFEYTMGDSMRGHWKGDLIRTPTGVRLKTIDSYKTDSWLMKMLMGTFFDLDGFAKDWNSKLKQRVELLAAK